MLIFGYSDIVRDLAVLALPLGYAVTICDPRSAFLAAERFPATVECVAAWPDRFLRTERARGAAGVDTDVIDLCHDERFSVPLLREALTAARWEPGEPPRYVGSLGSHARSAAKREQLRGAGVSEADLTRLHAPVGLDLGGRSPTTIALSILAQSVAVANCVTGLPLSSTTEPPWVSSQA
jgi:xanthine dehydrogenase accessory factor